MTKVFWRLAGFLLLAALAFGGWLAWNWRVERALCLCAKCGREVVLRQGYFEWNYGGGKPTVEYTRETLLSKLLGSKGDCAHGGLVNGSGANDDRLRGPERGDYLVLMEAQIKDVRNWILGGYGGHATGIGLFSYEIFPPNR